MKEEEGNFFPLFVCESENNSHFYFSFVILPFNIIKNHDSFFDTLLTHLYLNHLSITIEPFYTFRIIEEENFKSFLLLLMFYVFIFCKENEKGKKEKLYCLMLNKFFLFIHLSSTRPCEMKLSMNFSLNVQISTHEHKTIMFS